MADEKPTCPSVTESNAIDDADADAKTAELAAALRETNTTWELIAELSKNETTDVYSMILNHYNGREATAKRYLRYPASGVLELFEKLKTTQILTRLKISPLYSAESRSKGGKGSKGGKESKGSKGSKSGGGEKVKSGNGSKAAWEGRGQKTNKADWIREQQLISRAVERVGDFQSKQLRFDFSSNIVEIVLLYYMHVAYHALSAKQVRDFLGAAFSLRDAYLFFRSSTYGIDECVDDVVQQFMVVLQRRFPWKSFLANHTRFLITNHFRTRFQRALKPFKEQAALLENIKEEPHTLYVLPWGVGAGKTALIAPLSYIYERMGYQTLYCVPFGPVRDQSAALLYRCGIPFAYVTHVVDDEFELQPSYHCGNEKTPVVFIVCPTFVKYYLTYWERYLALVDYDPSLLYPAENPPTVSIPSHKRRYRHLSHTMWNSRFALVLDEPCDDHPHLMWVISQLPETSFVMSATSCDLIDEMAKERYRGCYGKEPRTIAAETIGVATTLVGRWLEGDPVLSPFSGVQTRAQFQAKREFIENRILWRRFLSPEVMVNWVERLRRERGDLELSISFDLMTLTFDNISERVLQWCGVIAESVEEDAFYRDFFALGTPKSASCEELLHMITTSHAHQFMGGCVVGAHNVPNLYRVIASELDAFPKVSEVERRVRENQQRIKEMYEQVNKMVIEKDGDRHRKEDRKREIEQQRMSSLPIDPRMILNTPEHVQQFVPLNQLPGQAFVRVQELMEDHDPSEDVKAWRIYPDVIPNLEDEYQRWRWKGVGSIMCNKEFNMKNIRDSDSGYLSFLLVDSIGAHGLNLKITHSILTRDARGRILPANTMLQVAGRVGRWGQEATGYVHILAPDIFTSVFA